MSKISDFVHHWKTSSKAEAIVGVLRGEEPPFKARQRGEAEIESGMPEHCLLVRSIKLCLSPLPALKAERSPPCSPSPIWLVCDY